MGIACTFAKLEAVGAYQNQHPNGSMYSNYIPGTVQVLFGCMSPRSKAIATGATSPSLRPVQTRLSRLKGVRVIRSFKDTLQGIISSSTFPYLGGHPPFNT